ncbi:MAG: hypothetical protein IJW25_00795 [Clostridia bacterium]|nr:hypothetical protein [Clostridia bacterium]
MAEKEFPRVWTPECGMTYAEWYQQFMQRLADGYTPESYSNAKGENIKLTPEEVILDEGRAATSAMRGKVARAVAIPTVLTAVGVVGALALTGGLGFPAVIGGLGALPASIIGGAAGLAIGAAPTWRTIAGALRMGTDPEILMYRVQKLQKRQEQRQVVRQKQLERLEQRRANMTPSEYKKEYDRLMLKIDGEMRKWEKKGAKIAIKTQKAIITHEAHAGTTNSIYDKGVVGWVNRRRQELGKVGDALTDDYFTNRNEAKIDAYQTVIEMIDSYGNKSNADRKSMGLKSNDIISYSLKQSEQLRKKFDTQVIEKMESRDRINTPKTGKEAKDDVYAYVNTRLVAGKFNIIEEVKNLNNSNFTKEQKAEIMSQIVSNTNGFVDTSNATKMKQACKFFKDMIDGNDFAKTCNENPMFAGRMALIYNDPQFQNEFNKHITASMSKSNAKERENTQTWLQGLIHLNGEMAKKNKKAEAEKQRELKKQGKDAESRVISAMEQSQASGSPVQSR